MKPYIGFLLIMTAFLLLVSCATLTDAAAAATETQPVPLPQEVGAADVAIETIVARVEVTSPGNVVLVADWDSKSRKTYAVAGDMGEVLRNMVDEIIEAEVIFLEKSGWSGSLVVVSIR